MASHSNTSTADDLLDAASTGNLKRLKKLALKLGNENGLASVTRLKDCSGRTALHVASSAGRTHVCKYLLENLNFDVNVKDWIGDTPLHEATLEDHLNTVICLLEKGADINAENERGLTALHYAAKQGHEKLISLLISKDAIVDANAGHSTPLQFAAGHGKKGAVKILLANSANPNACHEFLSPLLVSIRANSLECTKLLLQAGADPDICPCGMAPLTVAAFDGKTEIVKCLIEAGANPNITNNYGYMALEIAAMLGNHEGAMILYPATSRILTISDWSLGGIARHINSAEAIEQRIQKTIEIDMLSKSKGDKACREKDYVSAIYWYTVAYQGDPRNAAVLSNMSLCWARLNEGRKALSDAQACLVLRPDWPKAYYREGVAWKILKQFHKAADSFRNGLKLDPQNEELQIAFRDAVEAKQKDV